MQAPQMQWHILGGPLSKAGGLCQARRVVVLILSNIKAWLATWAATILAVIALAGWVAAGVQSYRLQGLKLEHSEDLNRAAQKARDIEQNWQSDAATIEEVHAAEIDRINADRMSGIERVRRYYANLPKTASSASAAAGSAIVPESTAAAAAALESDAERLRADYAACLAWVEAVKR